MNGYQVVDNKKKILGIIIGLVIIILLASIAIYSNVIKPNKYQEYLTLGNKYLIEGKYDEAILKFEKAIKINPKSTEVRIGAAKGYIGINNIDSAIETLEEAQNLEKTNEKLLKDIIDILIQVDSGLAYEFLDRFINEIGQDNISEYVKNLLSKNTITYNDANNMKNEIGYSIKEFENNIVKPADKSKLKNTINEAERLYSNAIEGRKDGQYKTGSKSLLKNEIDNAKIVYNNKSAKQNDIDKKVESLNIAINNFKKSKISTFTKEKALQYAINKYGKPIEFSYDNPNDDVYERKYTFIGNLEEQNGKKYYKFGLMEDFGPETAFKGLKVYEDGTIIEDFSILNNYEIDRLSGVLN